MRPERAIILIDGSNFYFKLKDLGLHTLDFHFSDFVKLLAGKRKLVQSTYFVGEVRTDGTAHVQKLYNNQQRLIARLKNHGVRYQFGYLLKSDGVSHIPHLFLRENEYFRLQLMSELLLKYHCFEERSPGF